MPVARFQGCKDLFGGRKGGWGVYVYCHETFIIKCLPMNRKLIAIVPAAGVGARARAGMPKQYQHIRGQAMLRIAVRALLADSRIQQVRVAVAPGDQQAAQVLGGLPRTVWRECGGPTRADTVSAALDDARQDIGLEDDDWVLVHDAARPGLPPDALQRLIDTCLGSGQGGLLALPVADTVKRETAGRVALASTGPGAASTPTVQSSVSRDGLWLAQTPQMFPCGLLRDALAAASHGTADVTDEASAVELRGYEPLLVQGSMRNFKVTWPEDAQLMERWLD